MTWMVARRCELALPERHYIADAEHLIAVCGAELPDGYEWGDPWRSGSARCDACERVIEHDTPNPGIGR